MAGRVSGLLYLTGAATAPALLLPGPTHPPPWLLWGEVGMAAVWGVICLTLLPWDRGPWWLSQVSSAAGLAMVTALIAGTGGPRSPAQLYLLFVIFFAAYFYPHWEAVGFIIACALVLALPLVYEPSAIHRGLLRELAIGIPTFLVAGGAIVGGRSVTDRLRHRAARLSAQHERLADEHASLRRVATAVATSSPPHAIFTLVASEALRLSGADGAAVVRFEGDEVELVGSCGPERTRQPAGARFPLHPESEMTSVRATGKPVRTDGYPPGSRHKGALLGYQSCVCVPVWVSQELWGGLCVTSRQAGALAPDTAERLLEFSHLVATSIANTERESELVRRASVDSLTGLANHRSFHNLLGSEVARAARHDRPLSLALVDVDDLKRVNEQLGHGAGDRLLIAVAEILEGLTRKGDMLARLGADEFALLLPETDKRSALVVLERARQMVGHHHVPTVDRVSFTAGICDLETAGGEGSLYRLTDAALRWGKARGRDVCWIYEPDIVGVEEGSGLHAVHEAERVHALAGLQALSRAIDAKDPHTRAHSERVAALASRLASARGWPADRIELLDNAALVHDVGKIGVPDAILLKPGRLEPAEYEVIKQHASLGARIVEGVLSPEQVEWVRSHHERPDGCGYPNGLLDGSISEGAALLALADAFDAMTAARSYGPGKPIETAVDECRMLAGKQFTEEAVGALEKVNAIGLLAAA